MPKLGHHILTGTGQTEMHGLLVAHVRAHVVTNNFLGGGVSDDTPMHLFPFRSIATKLRGFITPKIILIPNFEGFYMIGCLRRHLALWLLGLGRHRLTWISFRTRHHHFLKVQLRRRSRLGTTGHFKHVQDILAGLVHLQRNFPAILKQSDRVVREVELGFE
jgi:hypothetical protein